MTGAEGVAVGSAPRRGPMGTTTLWAEGVLRDRERVLDARGQSPSSRRHRRAAHRRPPRRLGALRATPILLVAAALGAGASAGTAYAYFGTTGSGAGQAHTGTLLPLVVEHASGTVATKLFPGGAGTLVLEVTNPNASAVTIVGVAQDGLVTVVGGGPGCTSGTAGTPGTSDVAVTGNVVTGLSLPVARGPSVHTTLVVPDGATMSMSSNTTCQGASFHIPVSVTVHL